MNNSQAKLAAKIGVGAALLAAGLVMHWEGYSPRVAPDPIGRLQVCYGHDDQRMVKGTLYTRAQCRALLDADLMAHAGVLDCITDPEVRGTLPDGIKAALVSLAYNAGVPRVCASTFVKRLNAGEGRAACAELSKWIYAGGKVLPGLVNRRADERKVCES